MLEDDVASDTGDGAPLEGLNPHSGQIANSLMDLPPEWSAPARQKWQETVARRVKQPVSWLLERKLREGSAATLLGLEFHLLPPATRPARTTPQSFEETQRDLNATGSIKWRALALGDSCLFHFRNTQLRAWLPVERSQDFCDRPPLLLTRYESGESCIWDQGRFAHGWCNSADAFVLATDAIAQWILRERESGNEPWQAIGRVRSGRSFQTWAAAERNAGRLKNDDLTLLIVRLIG